MPGAVDPCGGGRALLRGVYDVVRLVLWNTGMLDGAGGLSVLVFVLGE